jgi:hypothetical protein
MNDEYENDDVREVWVAQEQAKRGQRLHQFAMALQQIRALPERADEDKVPAGVR